MTPERLSSICVEPNATLREVLKSIDTAAVGFAIVLDDDGRLLGTITDGDIRRALLADTAPTTVAADLMNQFPKTLLATSNSAERHAFLAENKITFAPVVDKDRVLIDIHISERLPGNPLKDVAVVVMAGGLGSRLGKLTKQTPKPLLEVHGEPILQLIVKRFREEGFHRFIFCINHLGHQIKDHFKDGSALDVSITYVEEPKRMGTGGALSLIDATGLERLIVTNADILCSTKYRDLLEFHLDQEADGTMAVREHHVEIPFGVVETDGFLIKSLREKPRYTYFINAGYYVLEVSTLRHIPRDEFFDLPSLFEILRQRDGRTRIYPTTGDWIDVGRPEDLERARTLKKSD